jgi:hypothetical protein
MLELLLPQRLSHLMPKIKKSAQEYKHQLKLTGFDHISEMTKHYESWHRAEDSEIWRPNYAVV